MMNINRISAILYRHLRPTLRNPMRLMDMFYWPLLDIVLRGFTSLWLANPNGGNSQSAAMLLSSLVLWQVVFRASIEVTGNLLEELWHQNFTNLFASPLQLSEWLIGILCISLVNSLWNLLFGSFMAYLFFGIHVFSLGSYLVPFFCMLLLFGWFCGLTASAVILLVGRRAEMMAWSFPWLFSAFSCVFYPAHILPSAVQKVSWLLPATYVFENARQLIAEGQLDLRGLGLGFLLDLLFFMAAAAFFYAAFARAKNRGLNTLD